jgi:hexosaminidase
MKTRIFTAILLFALIPPAFGQRSGQELNLIPAPKQILVKPGSFEFSNDLYVKAKSLKNVGWEDFAALLQTETGVKPLSDKAGGNKYIRIQKRRIKGMKNPEGYRLRIEPERITITAPAEAGIFYAIQTLSQLVSANLTGHSIPCLDILDYPDIPIRGWQDDISRGPIPTLDFLKKEVRTLAGFKLNAMTLYTENVFRFKKHPDLAPDDGITEEQIAELSKYAAGYHVQVIGNFQSFGHMEKILSKPGYRHLAENGHILTPTKEESYRFLKDVYSEIVPAYSSPYFNINCDEVFGLGEGLSKKMADSIGIAGIYGYHINRLNDLLKPYHKRILMWGDIATNPKITALLPKDITVISWGYGDSPSFDHAIKPFTDQGLNFWVAPGISCWGNIFPNFQVSRVNISNYIRDGYKLGTTGVLNTTWDDDGLNFFENNWYGLVWGGEKSWNAPAPGVLASSSVPNGMVAGFDRAFDHIFFGVSGGSVVDLMNALSSLHQGSVRDMVRNSRFFEPVMPFYPEYVADSQVAQNSAVLKKVDSLDELLPMLRKETVRNAIDLDYLAFAIDEVRFSAYKNIFRIDLYRYLQGEEGALTPESLKPRLKILIHQSEQLKNRYAELWKLESRKWWLDRNMEKFDRLDQGLRDLRGMAILTVADTLAPAGRMMTLRSVFDNLPVHFTLDGSEPVPSSASYSKPVYLKTDVTIRARVFADGHTFPETVDSLVYHKAIGKLYKLNCHWSDYNPAYDAGGRLGLVDGRIGSVKDIRSGRWQGYSGQDINIELDFGRVDTLHSLSMGFYQHTFSWVILPKRLEIWASDDGVNYRKYMTLDHDIPVDYPDPIVHRFNADLKDLKTRYLKVIGVYYGPLPAFHASHGQESMMFADEVIVR